MRRILSLFLLGVLIPSSQALPNNELVEAKESIDTLLVCGWSLVGTSGSHDYKEYFVAAADLAAKKDISLEWLEKRIEATSNKFPDFAEDPSAATICLNTLRKSSD
jgi:predicted RNA binding protein YcfA (HicA-like mRNA interferase family)